MESPYVIPQVHIKKHKGLHDTDSRFVEEVIKVVSSLDGSSSMKLRVHSKFPTRFSITLVKPPKMSLDDMNQIFLMNGKVQEIQADVQENTLTIQSLKHREDTKKKRKRSIAYDELVVPTDYDLSMVDDLDKKHIEGILQNILGMTTMEFTSEIKPNAANYGLTLSDIESVNVEYISNLVQKFRAFVTETIFDFPEKTITMKIRRNDTPITNIMNKRKKVKVR
jgi:hypothetical protein